jgi:hypothetical protein
MKCVALSVHGAAALVAVCLSAGCDGQERAVDPDGHEHEARAQLSPIPEVPLDRVIGAVAGVPERDAAMVLERWLRASADGQRLLETWPRAEGRLDLARSPLRASAITASVGPGSKSRCGEVTVVFEGPARVALRTKLNIPGSVPSCRGLTRASRIDGGEAAPLLFAAIADAHVPDDVPPARLPDEIAPTAVAQN